MRCLDRIYYFARVCLKNHVLISEMKTNNCASVSSSFNISRKSLRTHCLLNHDHTSHQASRGTVIKRSGGEISLLSGIMSIALQLVSVSISCLQLKMYINALNSQNRGCATVQLAQVQKTFHRAQLHYFFQPIFTREHQLHPQNTATELSSFPIKVN